MTIMTVMMLNTSMNINEDNSYGVYDDISYNDTDKENDYITVIILYISYVAVLI